MTTSRDVVEKLTKCGWVKVAQKGSQFQFKHSEFSGRVTVPHPKRDVPIGTLRSIYRQAGLPWPP